MRPGEQHPDTPSSQHVIFIDGGRQGQTTAIVYNNVTIEASIETAVRKSGYTGELAVWAWEAVASQTRKVHVQTNVEVIL